METVSSSSLQTDYLQLFVTQIQNQDPLEPTEQKDFTQQLAQFSMLEGIEDLNKTVENSLATQQLDQAISIVGKGIAYQLEDADIASSGTVSEVTLNNDGLFAIVNDQVVPFSQIGSVYDPAVDDPSSN